VESEERSEAVLTNSGAQELERGVHLASHAYKIALIREGALGVYGPATRSYLELGDDEVPDGRGYATGGATLLGPPLTYVRPDAVWPDSTISAIGSVLYNASLPEKNVIAVFWFSGVGVSVDAPLTLWFARETGPGERPDHGVTTPAEERSPVGFSNVPQKRPNPPDWLLAIHAAKLLEDDDAPLTFKFELLAHEKPLVEMLQAALREERLAFCARLRRRVAAIKRGEPTALAGDQPRPPVRDQLDLVTLALAVEASHLFIDELFAQFGLTTERTAAVRLVEKNGNR
jgi:hypothetical protein